MKRGPPKVNSARLFFMLANIAVYILHISTNILDISLQSGVTSAPIQKLR